MDTGKEEGNEKWKEEVERAKNRYGKAEHQTEEEYQNWKNEQILNDLTNRKQQAEKDFSENIKKAEQLIANETHSEYFGMVSSPTDKSYHTVDTEKLKVMSNMIKEGLYD